MNSKESSDGARSSSDILRDCDSVNGLYHKRIAHVKNSCCYRRVSFFGLGSPACDGTRYVSSERALRLQIYLQFHKVNKIPAEMASYKQRRED